MLRHWYDIVFDTWKTTILSFRLYMCECINYTKTKKFLENLFNHTQHSMKAAAKENRTRKTI